jgi:AIPR protein
MELNDYRKELLEQVAVYATTDGDFRHSSFVEIAARLLEDAEELADFEICYYRGTGPRNKTLAVDGYATDDADGSVRIVVADFTGNVEPGSLTQTHASTLFGRASAFCEEALSGRLHPELEDSSPAFGLASLLYSHKASIPRFRFYAISDSLISARIRDLPEATVANIPAEFHIWDISRFHRVYESRTGRDDLEVDFTELVENGLPCLAASVDSQQYRAYLCVIPGEALAAIYDRFGSRLLEGNVRSFLTTRGKVNKAIRNTILNEPDMFFAFNNGIACTATAVDVEASAHGLRIRSAADLQIVNGGQTTASLSSARLNDHASLGTAFVPMKLSVVPPEKSGEIIPVISRCANSQNKVSEADFFSNHEFHRRIEQFSRRVWAPAKGGAQYETHWFYERARGQYLNEQSRMTTAEKKRFVLLHPREQVITKTDLAKYENTWRLMPHIVSQGAQKNFLAFSVFASEEWSRNSDQFNEEYFRRVVAKGILFHGTEKIVSEQAWYQGGYRANIVTYTLATLAHLIATYSEGQTFDFRAVWNAQGLESYLERTIASVAKEVFEIIVNPEGGFQNVTEWCKKEICWTRIREIRVTLPPALTRALIDREDERYTKKQSQKVQRVEDGIENQRAVLELGASYWKSARTWGRQHAMTTPDEDSILSVAVGMPDKLPSEKQSWRLLRIKEKLELEGFPKTAVSDHSFM